MHFLFRDILWIPSKYSTGAVRHAERRSRQKKIIQHIIFMSALFPIFKFRSVHIYKILEPRLRTFCNCEQTENSTPTVHFLTGCKFKTSQRLNQLCLHYLALSLLILTDFFISFWYYLFQYIFSPKIVLQYMPLQ